MHMRKKVLFCIGTLMLVLQSFAQSSPVIGKVVDEQGNPLAGVTVSKKNSKVASLTFDDGQFKLNAAPGDTLLFSALGFETKQAVAESNLTVTLKADVKSLAEVVVTG